jgi:7-cyano-7-deazaguanine synthase
MEKKALVLLSGGVDSMACAHFLIATKYNVSAMFLDYGQAARQHESSAASCVAAEMKLPLRKAEIRLGTIFGVGEVVGRNALLIFSALATGAAGQTLAMGIHSGTSYYDCSPLFANRIDLIVQEQTNGLTRFFTPFIEWGKAEIYAYCREHKLNLSITYSCEAGTVPVCGKCASCLDREMLDAR